MATRQNTHQSIGCRQFWAEFFVLYESLPALWDARNPLYKERQAKTESYELLVAKMRQIEPNACREDVLRKINIFRTNYRRECARINASHELGKRYRTSLWYFDLLNFLQSQESRHRERKCKSEEKSILRRKSAKQQSARAALQSALSVRPSKELHAIELAQEHTNTRTSPHQFVKYESHISEGNESADEQVGHLQYTDEKSFQQQFQNQFHTLSFDRTSCSANAKNSAMITRQTLNDDPDTIPDTDADDDEEKVIVTAETDAFHELINIDESPHTHEILEEIEQEEQLCGKLAMTAPPAIATNTIIAAKHTADKPAHATPKKLSKTHGITTMKLHSTPPRAAQQSRGERIISAASEILAKSWAIQYDEMSAQQRIYARKAIAEILFEGCLGNLGRRNSGNRTMTSTKRTEHYEATEVSDDEDSSREDAEKVGASEYDEDVSYLYADGTEVNLNELMR